MRIGPFYLQKCFYIKELYQFLAQRQAVMSVASPVFSDNLFLCSGIETIKAVFKLNESRTLLRIVQSNTSWSFDHCQLHAAALRP
jgi:hypothetical protein